MKFKKLIIVIIISIFNISHAKIFKLECINNSNFVVKVTVDDIQKMVLFNDRYARNVYINDDEINFIFDLDGTPWFHSISRYSGNMLVQNSVTKFILTTNFVCKGVANTDRKF